MDKQITFSQVAIALIAVRDVCGLQEELRILRQHGGHVRRAVHVEPGRYHAVVDACEESLNQAAANA